MPRRNIPVTVSRRGRIQPLGRIEALCCNVLGNRQPLTVGVPDLLVLESAVSESSQFSLWNAVSDRALPGLLGIYALSIRRSCALLEPCSATEAQHHASVREALSKQLSNVPNPNRARQIALSILRGQSLRCYAVLLADAASSLIRQPSKRNEDSAGALMREVGNIMQFVENAKEAESGAGPPLSELLYAELLASSLLEHWARLLLTLASREGSAHAHAASAVHLQRFRTALAPTARLNPKCAHRLLASSPCLSYLLASQLVALCAVLDGGTVYGMPAAPGGALAVATLPLCRAGRECDRSLKTAIGLAIDTLAALPPLQGCQSLPGAEPTCVSQPTGTGEGAALAVPEAATASSAGGTTTAESHSRDSGATPSAPAPSAPAGAAPVPSEAAQCQGPQSAGHTAASLQPYGATGQATAPPTLLLNPAVRLEVSLRLVTALGRTLAPTQFDAQDGIGKRHCPEAGQPPWLRQLLEASLSLPRNLALQAAHNALVDAWQVLRGAQPPHVCPRPLMAATRTVTDPAARESLALSPLERWWGGAVAMGWAVAGAASAAAALRVDSELVQELVIIVDEYFGLMEEAMKSLERAFGPPAQQPSESVAAALTAGLLPCLERLLRAVLQLPLASEWAHRLGWGWDAAWAQMLAFADAGEVAALVDTAAEGLHRAVAACSAASQCQGGSTAGTASSASADTHSVQRLESAAHLASRLAGNLAFPWLPILAEGLFSEAGSPDGGASDGGGGVGARAFAARLGEPLSLIFTRLLPEISRALLGGLLPLFRRGVVGLSSMCVLVGRQLEWVPTLAAALAASSASSAAADGSTDGGGCSSGGGPSASGGGPSASGGSPCAARWRQLLFVELRLPSLLGAALELSLSGDTAEESNKLILMCQVLKTALDVLAALVPADLARMVAAADRAEAAAACRTVASCSPAGAAASPPAPAPAPSPPSSGLLRRALGPGGALEDAELLAAVEAACAGRVGAGAGMPGGIEGKGGLLPDMKELLLGAWLLVLHG